MLFRSVSQSRYAGRLDHGIETPEARIAAGKPPKGRIEIAAGYRGNQTVITISDDGNGVDFEKLRDRALQMGLSESDLAGSSEVVKARKAPKQKMRGKTTRSVNKNQSLGFRSSNFGG